MPINPTSPQPPFVEPGKSPPLPEVENPGHGHPERDADPEPLERDDDPLDPPGPERMDRTALQNRSTVPAATLSSSSPRARRPS